MRTTKIILYLAGMALSPLSGWVASVWISQVSTDGIGVLVGVLTTLIQLSTCFVNVMLPYRE
jgi:hypothetical protein